MVAPSQRLAFDISGDARVGAGERLFRFPA